MLTFKSDRSLTPIRASEARARMHAPTTTRYAYPLSEVNAHHVESVAACINALRVATVTLAQRYAYADGHAD